MVYEFMYKFGKPRFQMHDFKLLLCHNAKVLIWKVGKCCITYIFVVYHKYLCIMYYIAFVLMLYEIWYTAYPV